jgi:hypothetical protein
MNRSSVMAWGAAGVALAAVTAFVLWPRKASPASTRSPSEVILTNQDHGKTIAVHVGQTIVFQWPGNLHAGAKATLTVQGDAGVWTVDSLTVDLGKQPLVFRGRSDREGTIAVTVTVTGAGGSVLQQLSFTLVAVNP